MPRIRTIKPEFPQSESMGRISREARLLFVLLWTIADDSGRARAASRLLASLLYPYDDDAASLIDGWLDELRHEGCIMLYEEDGARYLEVCKWLMHQKIDKPTPSRLPAPRESSRILANPREASATDLGPRTMDQGPGSKDRGARTGDRKDHAASAAARPRARAIARPQDVSEATWADWLTHRRGMRAAVTAAAMDGIRREADRAGIPLEDALATAMARGWRGFKAEWVREQQSRDDRMRFDPAASLATAEGARRLLFGDAPDIAQVTHWSADHDAG